MLMGIMLKPKPDRGTYQLVLAVQQPVAIQIGALGIHTLMPGRYIYIGRAKKGLAQRLARHQQKEKVLHWHIDYLTSHPQVLVENVQLVSDDPNQECSTVTTLVFDRGYKVPIRRFGSSDCHSGCPAHLVYLIHQPPRYGRSSLQGRKRSRS